jgi:hypothetical protein
MSEQVQIRPRDSQRLLAATWVSEGRGCVRLAAFVPVASACAADFGALQHDRRGRQVTNQGVRTTGGMLHRYGLDVFALICGHEFTNSSAGNVHWHNYLQVNHFEVANGPQHTRPLISRELEVHLRTINDLKRIS